MEICWYEPRVHHALQIAAHVIVDEEKIRPHVLPARLALEVIKFVPKRSRVEAPKPRGMKKHKKEQNRCESNVPIDKRFYEQRDIFEFMFVDVRQEY